MTGACSALLLLGVSAAVAAPAPAAVTAPAGLRTPPPPLARIAPSPPPARRVVLANGLRVVVVERHARPIVAIRLLLARGSLSDSAGSPGVTHLAVHLAVDFYEKSEQGEPLPFEKSLRKQLLELGAAPIVHVKPDFSMLGVSGYAQDTGKYLEMLAQAVTRPRRGEDSFKSRRDMVLDEIEDLEASDPAALSRVIAEAAFGPGHPYSRSVIGTLSSLGPMGLEDAAAQQDRVLVPEGATLLVVGDVAPEKVFAEVRSAFGRWEPRNEPPRAPPAPAAVPAGVREVGLLRRRPASTLVVCATRPLSDVRGSDAALDALAALVGQGGASRLAVALRGRSGLTYTAGATIVRRRHARAFVACSPIAAGRAAEGIRLFRETLEAVRATPATPEELERARAICGAELDAAYDDALGTAGAWVEAIALGRPDPRLAEQRAELDLVTAGELQALASRVLRADTLRWILSGEPDVAATAVRETALGTVRVLEIAR